MKKTKLLLTTAFIISAVVCLFLSCSKERTQDMRVHYVDIPFTLTFDGVIDGRPLYKITFSDGVVLNAMYPEEIAQSLIQGRWEYNEDLRIK